MQLRPDLQLIADWIPANSRVLDLGCGDGALLQLLAAKGCRGTGVDLDPDDVLSCLSSGVDVIELDLDTELDQFQDSSYDFVVLSRTLQNVRKPREVLAQMGRIALHSVVSIPNFVHWRNRLRLLRGRMPMSRDLPFEWFDTPNLHYTSVPDLEPLFASVGMRIDQRLPLDAAGHPHRLGKFVPNLLASSCLYLLHARR